MKPTKYKIYKGKKFFDSKESIESAIEVAETNGCDTVKRLFPKRGNEIVWTKEGKK